MRRTCSWGPVQAPGPRSRSPQDGQGSATLPQDWKSEAVSARWRWGTLDGSTTQALSGFGHRSLRTEIQSMERRFSSTGAMKVTS
ncbi:MAG: hypothetical protein ACI9VR_004091 [Cognaticolwellia sp.]|jgi:hypothetical protein